MSDYKVRMAAGWALSFVELGTLPDVGDGGLIAVEIGANAYKVDFADVLHEVNRIENTRHEFADIGGEG